MQKNSGGRGKSQSLARLRGQLVSCRKWMSLPAMPALVPIERKTSVTQSGGKEDEEPEEARERRATSYCSLSCGGATYANFLAMDSSSISWTVSGTMMQCSRRKNASISRMASEENSKETKNPLVRFSRSMAVSN